MPIEVAVDELKIFEQMGGLDKCLEFSERLRDLNHAEKVYFLNLLLHDSVYCVNELVSVLGNVAIKTINENNISNQDINAMLTIIKKAT